MKTVTDIGFWFLISLLLIDLLCIIVFALLLEIYYRLFYYKPKRHFLAKARANFQKRFPYLNAESFTPIVTLPSPCCKTMFWLDDNSIRNSYFCDHCGKRYMKKYSYDLKEYIDELEYMPYERTLATLNELYKSWATAKKTSNP